MGKSHPLKGVAPREVANLTCIVHEGGFGAGEGKSVGRVTEPRKLYICGHWIVCSKQMKVQGLHAPEDSSPLSVMRGDGSPPGSVMASGARAQRDGLGTWEIQSLLLHDRGPRDNLTAISQATGAPCHPQRSIFACLAKDTKPAVAGSRYR